MLGPIVVIVAVLLGGCALRVMDRFDPRLPARACRRRRVRAGARHRARAPRFFPAWSEKAARLFLAGGCARFNDQTIQRVKEQTR